MYPFAEYWTDNCVNHAGPPGEPSLEAVTCYHEGFHPTNIGLPNPQMCCTARLESRPPPGRERRL